MYPECPEGTQVIVGSMNMGYISDTAKNRTHNLFRPKREPVPLGHSDGHTYYLLLTPQFIFPNSNTAHVLHYNYSHMITMHLQFNMNPSHYYITHGKGTGVDKWE